MSENFLRSMPISENTFKQHAKRLLAELELFVQSGNKQPNLAFAREMLSRVWKHEDYRAAIKCLRNIDGLQNCSQAADTGMLPNGESNQLSEDQGAVIESRPLLVPPTLVEVGVGTDLERLLVPNDGLTIISGPTQSGKSSLLAGTLRHILENPNSHKIIASVDPSIEYSYKSIPILSSCISQIEIGAHKPFKTYDGAMRSIMRRAPDIITIGEVRDVETLEAVAHAAQFGFSIYQMRPSAPSKSACSRSEHLGEADRFGGR